MKNELILSRKLNVETWNIQGSIAKAHKREDMMLVLQFLDEFPRSTAKEFANHLLFDGNSRRVVAERLLDLSSLYGLSNNESGSYKLTEKGQEALANKMVFIPEDGCWTLTVSNDPLLPHNVIDIKAFDEPHAISEIIGKEAKTKLDSRKHNMGSVPLWIKQCVGTELDPHLSKGKIRIDSIENKAEKVTSNIFIKLEWNVTKDSVRILENNKVLNQFDGPRITENDILETALAKKGLLPQWDSKARKLKASFGSLDSHSYRSMVTNLKCQSLDIQKYGDFADIVIEGIDLNAASLSDAKKWAEWRLDNSISNFATTNLYETWIESATAPFLEFGISLSERDSYAEQLWNRWLTTNNKPQKVWHMIAATDWQL